MPVATGRALYESAVDIKQADRQPIELQFGAVAQQRNIEPGRAGRFTHPAVESGHILIVKGILQRQHRHDMSDLTERAHRSATHALSRGCRIGPFRMRRLERHQLMEEAVVLCVGNHRRIEHIVGMVMALKLTTQRVDCRTGLR